MPSPEEYRFLECLGTTPDEVADGLRFLEVKGVRGNMLHCPIGRALKKMFDKPYTVTGVVGTEVGTILCYLPAPVNQFITRFDNGEFQDLNSHEEGIYPVFTGGKAYV